MDIKITLDGTFNFEKDKVILNGSEFQLFPVKKERPQVNPKQYTAKEIMKHLVDGGWVENRDYSNASYYYWLTDKGYYSLIFKRDDERSPHDYQEKYPYDKYPYDLGLQGYTLGKCKYFLIKPIEKWTIGRCGEDV